MAVREFTDSRGREWRAWDVTPEHVHPATRGEDFMSVLQNGWLAFQSGTEKRRLSAPYPPNWTTASIAELEALCQQAKLVSKRGAQSDTGKRRAERVSNSEREAMEAAHAQITFRSPRGREWCVRVHECLDKEGAHQMVLRFTADDIVVELPEWPENWQSATPAEFALMLLDANPPRRRKKGEGPQRRREDRVSVEG